MTEIKKSEVLAPVGNSEMLVAAVRSGANAVYLGAKEFSARRNAPNFDREELKNAVQYCHIRGVRVYLTLNILIAQSEMEAAFDLAKFAFNIGIDGVIVQDLGLARILHKYIPELKLHASTQMSVHSPSALPILKELGFCQVVAAREMSREELKALCDKAKELDITVEVFVHGALCMSVSGQCLLSAFLGSRSGNRGLCAGPCRLPFKAQGGTGYDLSLKDLSLLPYINELRALGVGSFKIEGRMKRPEYVAAAVTACREAVDKGFVSQALDATLKDVFSRSGFTDGYYTSRLGKDMFGIRTKEDVLSADKAFPRLHEYYRAERAAVPLSISVEIKEGKPLMLTLCDGENTVTAGGGLPEKAQSKAVAREDVVKNIEKLGSTPYFAQSISVGLDDGLFVRMSELNSLRRTACEKLDLVRGNVKNTPLQTSYTSPPKQLPQNGRPKLLARFASPEQIPENLSGISGIIYPLEAEADGLGQYDIPLIADVPRGIVSEKATLEKLKGFKQKGFCAALCGNLAAVSLAKQAGLAVVADGGLNLANSEALVTAADFGCEAAIVSVEQPLEKIVALPSPIKKGIIAYGNIPLMLLKNCPLKNGISCAECDKNGRLTDRLGVEFPVNCRGGYSELYNSLPIWLADRQNDLSGLDFAVLYFTRESRQTAAQVIEAYKKSSPPLFKHTRGLYYRGTV